MKELFEIIAVASCIDLGRFRVRVRTGESRGHRSSMVSLSITLAYKTRLNREAK